MLSQDFSHVAHWVFDLDNTLYPPEVRLFDQIERHMHTYVMRELDVSEMEASHLRERYWRDHGTTLNGLMLNHNIDPGPFLKEVHDLDLSNLSIDEKLGAAIMGLPGRKIVYTNGSRAHGERVVEARGLSAVFDRIYGVEDAGYVSKPHRRAFEAVFLRDDLNPDRAAMFEDDPRNLEVPFALGMKTILVGSAPTARHIEHQTRDLAGFLSQLAGATFS